MRVTINIPCPGAGVPALPDGWFREAPFIRRYDWGGGGRVVIPTPTGLHVTVICNNGSIGELIVKVNETLEHMRGELSVAYPGIRDAVCEVLMSGNTVQLGARPPQDFAEFVGGVHNVPVVDHPKGSRLVIDGVTCFIGDGRVAIATLSIKRSGAIADIRGLFEELARTADVLTGLWNDFGGQQQAQSVA